MVRWCHSPATYDAGQLHITRQACMQTFLTVTGRLWRCQGHSLLRGGEVQYAVSLGQVSAHPQVRVLV